MNRKEYLNTAERIICNDRQDVHGNPENCFGAIADYWSIYLTNLLKLDVEVSPADVAVMMSLFKTARWQMNPEHQDNLIDNLGYTALAGELHDLYSTPKGGA